MARKNNKYRPVDLSKLKTFSIGARSHKFGVDKLASLPPKGTGFVEWWESLPPYLGASAIRDVATAIVAARRADRPVVFAMGAHPVKVGCSPVICDLINRGIVTAVAMNGATAIHDVEVATTGATTEEVADTIGDGTFGMVTETPAIFAEALGKAEKTDAGLGTVVGEYLLAIRPENVELSILATCAKVGIPVTVHVAIGTDTIHMHEAVAESDLANRSMVDFRLVCSVVSDLASDSKGSAAGVWCNVGSAVVMPEVFLKAVAVARNLGSNLDDMTTANFDMIRHYRPSENVIGRPVRKGRGHHITGHHEIMLPLLRQALVEMF